MNYSFKKSFIFISFLFVGFVMLLTACDYFFKPASFEEVMKEPTKRLNKKCPVMIDQEIRLDSGTVLPNKIFQYNYTLVSNDKLSLNVEGLKKDVEVVLSKRVKTYPDLQIIT